MAWKPYTPAQRGDQEHIKTSLCLHVADEDVFWYVEPGVGLEVNLSRSFRLAFGASKRLTQDLDLLNTDERAFDRTSYFITLKVGGF